MNYALETENICYTLGENKILEDVSFGIEEGNYVSIIGPNGAGKTSLIKIILGLTANYKGKIKIFGADPQNLDPGIIGYVPQVKTIDRNFPATVRELVLNGIRREWAWKISKAEEQKIEDILKYTGMENAKDRQLARLSGGELQRAFLARAFARMPKLLILDEPGTGVDAKAEFDIEKVIEQYKERHKTTILTITHDWNIAFYHSDKVLMLNRKIYAYDVPKKAFADEIVREVFGHVGHHHEMFGKDDCHA